MATEGIDAVFLETHNWGRSAKFFQSLGFELEFATDHNSGQLRNGSGPSVFIAEVPEDREPSLQIVLKVPDADAFEPGPGVEVVSEFADTHYGTREMIVRDPDGRLWNLQAPAKGSDDEDSGHGGTRPHGSTRRAVAGAARRGRRAAACAERHDRPRTRCSR